MYCSNIGASGYHFESADRLCEEFNALVNAQKNDKKMLDQEKHPWLEDSDERKYMTDRGNI